MKHPHAALTDAHSGLFARKLLLSHKEKELRRLEKKKAKEQRKKK